MSIDEYQDELFSPEDDDYEGLFDEQLSLPLPFVRAPQPFATVIKRDGRKVPFDRDKIARAIFKAAQAVGGQDRHMADSLAAAVTIYLGKRLEGQPPAVDQVQDAVERVLIQMSHASTALAFARYRDRRRRIQRLREGDMRVLLSELEEARIEHDALGGHGAEALFVRTSSDTLTHWDREKIVAALVRETELDTATAMVVALEVEQQIREGNLSTLTTSLVRELVGAKLVEHGLEEHRERHRRLGVPLYDTEHIIRGTTADTVARDPVSTDRVLARSVKREYALAQIFSAPVSEAHLRGELHLHHLGLIDRLYSLDHSLESVVRYGIGVPGTENFATPPKYADTLLAQMAKYSGMLHGFFAGRIRWDALNVLFAPFLYGFNKDQMAQFAQVLVYEYAFRVLAHGEAPTALSLHWTVPDWLKNATTVNPGGPADRKTYKDYEHTAQEFAWAIMEVFQHGGVDSITFPAPIPYIHINEDFFRAPGHGEFLEQLARAAALRKNVHFLLEREETARPTTTSRTWQARRASMQRVTLNLPRAAYQGTKEAALRNELDRLFDLAIAAHQEKLALLESLWDQSGNSPLGLLAQEYDGAPSLDLYQVECQIAVDGLNECVQVLMNMEMHEADEAASLGRRILEHLQHLCNIQSTRHGLKLVLAQNDDQHVSERFATLDLQGFPKTARTTVKADPVSQALHYTPGAQLSRNHGLNPIEGVRIEGTFHSCFDTESYTSVRLPHEDTSPASIGDFLKKAYHQTQNRLIVFH
jgi:ribonucleoside-triphosphate reductase